MKRVVSFIIMAAMAVSLVSCGSSRKAVAITEGEKEVDLIFSGKEYRTDKKYFRDNGFGVSKDLANAKKIALQELGRTVVDTQLSGLEVVEEKAFRQPDGTYRYHVCMQLDKDNLSKAMSKALDKDVNTRLRADKDKFRAYFDEMIRQ